MFWDVVALKSFFFFFLYLNNACSFSSLWTELCCAWSCLTLCNPMDGSLPGSSVHGIYQAGIQEYWGGLPFPTMRDSRKFNSRDSSSIPDPGIEPMSLADRFFTIEPPWRSVPNINWFETTFSSNVFCQWVLHSTVWISYIELIEMAILHWTIKEALKDISFKGFISIPFSAGLGHILWGRKGKPVKSWITTVSWGTGEETCSSLCERINLGGLIVVFHSLLCPHSQRLWHGQ